MKNYNLAMKERRGFPKSCFRGGSAFTLIEMLVVIAILLILLSLLGPGVRRIRERSDRIHCANNLRNIGAAITIARIDHVETLKNQVYVHPSAHWISTDMRDVLLENGVSWEMLFCRANKAYTAIWMTEAQRTISDGIIPIGYAYVPGQAGIDHSEFSTLVVDLYRSWNNNFESGMNHEAGANHLLNSGAVLWVDAKEFKSEPAIHAGPLKFYFRK